MTNRSGEPSPFSGEIKPVPPAEILHEVKAEAIGEEIEKELFGKNEMRGIFARIQDLKTREEERALVKELGSLISRSSLLFLAGYPEAAALSVKSFRTMHIQLKERQRALDEREKSYSSLPLHEGARAATVLEYALNLVANDPDALGHLKTIPSFSVADYTLLKEEGHSESFKLLAHRVLKASLHRYFAEAVREGRLAELPPEMSDAVFSVEKNDLSRAGSSHYEKDLFGTIDVQDDATRQRLARLTEEYKQLAGETYNEQDGMREGGLWRTFFGSSLEDVESLQKFAEFEKRWLNLQLELARLPRKSA